MFTVSTMQVDDGRIELLNPNEIILRNTGKKPTASERLVAGAVQSELNSIYNTQLDVDGWYGRQSAGTVADLQKELSLPATGVLDVQTFYQLQLAVESGVWYERSAEQVAAGAVIQQPTGNTGPNYAPPSSVWGDYNGNGIPDQYDGYAQGMNLTASSGEEPSQESNNEMTWPTLSTIITSDFGVRNNPKKTKEKNAKTEFHAGIDIRAVTRNVDGDEIYASVDGTVSAVVLDHKSGGNIITILSSIDDKKVKVKYMHLQDDSIVVEKGDMVEAGVVIANMGSTGRSTGTHLHFQVEVYNEETEKWVAVDPEKYINRSTGL